MPITQKTAIASCTDGVTTSDTQTTTVHPNQSEILQVVEYPAAAIEGTFTYPSYAPLTAVSGKSYTKTFQFYELTGACVCPPSWFVPVACDGEEVAGYSCELVWPDHETEDQSYSASFSFPSSVGTDIAGYLSHNEALPRYINSWCNPHWSYALWTQDWEVDLNPETWNDYWKYVGSQWINNSPAAISRDTRNHLVSEGLTNDGNQGFLETFFGGLRWLGISRWHTKEVTPRTDYTYGTASETLWTADQGTITMDATEITVTP